MREPGSAGPDFAAAVGVRRATWRATGGPCTARCRRSSLGCRSSSTRSPSSTRRDNVKAALAAGQITEADIDELLRRPLLEDVRIRSFRQSLQQIPAHRLRGGRRGGTASGRRGHRPAQERGELPAASEATSDPSRSSAPSGSRAWLRFRPGMGTRAELTTVISPPQFTVTPGAGAKEHAREDRLGCDGDVQQRLRHRQRRCSCPAVRRCDRHGRQHTARDQGHTHSLPASSARHRSPARPVRPFRGGGLPRESPRPRCNGPGGAGPGNPRSEPEHRRCPEDWRHGAHAVAERRARTPRGMVSGPGRR